ELDARLVVQLIHSARITLPRLARSTPAQALPPKIQRTKLTPQTHKRPNLRPPKASSPPRRAPSSAQAERLPFDLDPAPFPLPTCSEEPVTIFAKTRPRLPKQRPGSGITFRGMYGLCAAPTRMIFPHFLGLSLVELLIHAVLPHARRDVLDCEHCAFYA